ncbi:hypothetical protein MLD38_018749 [Melastoma candidum]|uniref:Uncharacterized protein n=1 Tax=Melastoma candidum TaxID=119954 RepID=A0ACB9QUY6_9MYRT|nr:hypothetical protein MLD38_018749 [Melastoma candidum]
MGDFSVQISNELVDRLLDNGERLKRKPRKIKPRVPKEVPPVQTKPVQTKPVDDSGAAKGPSPMGWPLPRPLYMPETTPSSSMNAELDAIRSVLAESEKVVGRLRAQEENMTNEVTQRAKELHQKEFKLPHQKPMPCLAESNACMECYKEHIKDPLKCAHMVKSFADCARRARQQVSSLQN